jgi:hypothetical protein
MLYIPFQSRTFANVILTGISSAGLTLPMVMIIISNLQLIQTDRKLKIVPSNLEKGRPSKTIGLL